MYRVLLALCLGACAYTPTIDPKGVDEAKYQEDLAECQRLAEEANPAASALGGGIAGAAVGAAFGAIVGAFAGDAAYGAGYGAGVGGASGAVAGGAGGLEEKRAMVRRCLTGRGYSVLR